MSNNLSAWSLGTVETGKSCGAHNMKSSTVWKVHSPKILPMVPFGKAKTTPVSLNKNCYCNASACKPNVATQIQTRNYLNIPLGDDSNIGVALHGSGLKMQVFDGDVDKMYIVSKSK